MLNSNGDQIGPGAWGPWGLERKVRLSRPTPTYAFFYCMLLLPKHSKFVSFASPLRTCVQGVTSHNRWKKSMSYGVGKRNPGRVERDGRASIQ